MDFVTNYVMGEAMYSASPSLMNEAVDDVISFLTEGDWKVDYTVDNTTGKMTNIEFVDKNGHASYIDVIQRTSMDDENKRIYKVVCYGDCGSFMFHHLWWDNLNNIDSLELEDALNNLEAGKGRVFDYVVFLQDAMEYFETRGYNDETLGKKACSDIWDELNEINDYICNDLRIYHLTKIEEIIKASLGLPKVLDFMSNAFSWGNAYSYSFLSVMAIIKIAQDAYRER